MRKMLPVFLVTLCILVLVALVPHTFAQNDPPAGGSLIAFPPTTEGPGMILPDSPFFFLDLLKQNVRLAFAVTPTMKARVYSSIAGERIAELRFELARNNITAAEIAVRGIRENTENAAKAVNEAKLWGTDTSDLAREINLSIKEHEQELDILESESSGALKAEVYIAQASLSDAKSLVEQSLPKDEITGELQYDTQRNAYRQTSLILENATSLKNSLDLLQQIMSSSSGKTTTSKVNKDIPSLFTKQASDKAEIISKNAGDIQAIMKSLQAVHTSTPTPTTISK